MPFISPLHQVNPSNMEVQFELGANINAYGTLATGLTTGGGITPAPVGPHTNIIPIGPASVIQSSITEIGTLKIKIRSRVDMEVDTSRHHRSVREKAIFYPDKTFSYTFETGATLPSPNTSILVIAAADATEHNTLVQTIGQVVPPYSAVVYLRRQAGSYASPFRDNTPTIPVDSESVDPAEIAALITKKIKKIIAKEMNESVEEESEGFQQEAMCRFKRIQDELEARAECYSRRPGHRRLGFVGGDMERASHRALANRMDQLSISGNNSSSRSSLLHWAP